MAKAKSEAKAAVAALEASVSHLLHRAVQLADDLHADAFGADGLTQRQFALLVAVEAKEGAAQAELVQLTGIDRSTLAELTSRMIAKGLLVRERSESDGRANAVHLSEAGRAALAEARARMTAADERLLKRVGGRGRRAAFLEMLTEMLSGERPGKAERKRDRAARKKTKKAA
jgi:MarR family transcriptional regulator, temperature-dependent positive regulator of motility